MTAPIALRQVVAGLCDEVGPRLTSDAARIQVRRVRQRLDEPLRVAIAGRLKAGKSTLVNALIGRRVAPTEVGECTRVVTQFRYGTADRVDVVRRDGSRVSLPLDESGMIPQRLGVPAAEVAYVDVALTSANLRDLTVVDTPGLSSTNASVSAGARRFLFEDNTAPIDEGLDADSAGAISGAEAIVYVFTQAVRDDDVAALEAFRSVSARLASNPINSVGLFNKADKLVDGAADPWPVAERLADDQGKALRRVVSGVVPVVGLLAETTEAGRLTAADCEALRVLSGMPLADRTLLLASVDLFVSRPASVPREHRERLLTLLDLYGIGFSLAQLAAHPTLGSGDLVRMLYQASGFPRLRHTLDHAFRWRTDAIKAGWALSTLEKAAGHADTIPDREVLRDAIERVLQRPEYHRLRLLEVAQQVSGGAVELPAPMEQELTRLALSQDPQWILSLPTAGAGELREAALAAAARWRVFAVAGASPAQSRVALVVHRGFHLLSQRLRAEVAS
ncbi:isoniazid inducible gene protein IniC [Asanoa ishikariensis]|uniref:Dynamin family protein n=1 Tax=Asanoa ishikariensis TaxID=137265 RepID=A0A1H3T7F5_9ACTN|nr:dynamin family protein [Asanoa ishikariensis]GIF62900.1 isoniazid inducible gene protein IniC [Asanoa ishikariensis]SDZ46176.1 Dynamin family protein [Asanoa ishikariensis]